MNLHIVPMVSTSEDYDDDAEETVYTATLHFGSIVVASATVRGWHAGNTGHDAALAKLAKRLTPP